MLLSIATGLLLFAASNAVSIPMCSLRVFVGQTPHKFLPSDPEQYTADAERFCKAHQLLWSDCDRVKAAYAETCLSRQTNEDRTKQPEHEITQGDETPGMAQSPEEALNASSAPNLPKDNIASDNSDKGIDYSTPNSPALIVHYKEATLKLVRYRGETQEQSVHRFCKMHQMLESECTQVRDAFKAMLCERMQEGCAPAPPTPELEEQPHAEPDVHDFTDTWLQKAYNLFLHYWKYIVAVVVVVATVALR